MTEFIKEVKLVALREGTYTIYVFQELLTNEFIFCTRLPNWQVPNIDIGDIGFLQYREVRGGDEYFNPVTYTTEIYQFSNVYFTNFVRKSDVIVNKEIIL